MNKVMLIGRLTKDPEVRPVGQNQTSCCQFTIAVNRKGNKDVADFINCAAWGQRADFIGKWFTKGKRIALEGQIQTRKYQTQSGETRYITEVIVDGGEFVDSHPQAQEQAKPIAPDISEQKILVTKNEPKQTSLEELFGTDNEAELPFPLD